MVGAAKVGFSRSHYGLRARGVFRLQNIYKGLTNSLRVDLVYLCVVSKEKDQKQRLYSTKRGCLVLTGK